MRRDGRRDLNIHSFVGYGVEKLEPGDNSGSTDGDDSSASDEDGDDNNASGADAVPITSAGVVPVSTAAVVTRFQLLDTIADKAVGVVVPPPVPTSYACNDPAQRRHHPTLTTPRTHREP